MMKITGFRYPLLFINSMFPKTHFTMRKILQVNEMEKEPVVVGIVVVVVVVLVSVGVRSVPFCKKKTHKLCIYIC